MTSTPARTATRVLLTAVLSGALLSACTGGTDAVDQNSNAKFRYSSATKKGSLIPQAKRKLAGPVAGSLLTGSSYQLSQDKGHVVVLNFFASWCGPCQIETPQFDALFRQRKASGVRFVGLDVKESERSGAQAWVQAKQVSYPVVYDQAAKSALQLGNVPLAGLPDTVLIDKLGRVAAVWVGSVLPKDLEPALDELAREAT